MMMMSNALIILTSTACRRQIDRAGAAGFDGGIKFGIGYDDDAGP